MSYLAKTYNASSGRGSGSEKVLCVTLTSHEDVLQKDNNPVLAAIKDSGLNKSIGLYFYRFKSPHSSFIKIGESTRKDGIEMRFKRGWHYSHTCNDTYLKKKRDGRYESSEFYDEIMKIRIDNPAYFVFYEYAILNSFPKIDELYAYHCHKRLFKTDTLSPERMNGNSMLGRKLIWHKKAFSEVARCRFPCGQQY